jgi:membrane-bound lytic murein transglycosylase D
LSKILNFILLLTLGLFSGYQFFYKTAPATLKFVPDHQLRHQRIISRIPDDLTFAGENIHFKTPDAYLKYYRELRVNTANNSSTRLLLKNVNMLLPAIERILVENRVPRDFKYLAVAESNLSHEVISGKGAAGIWQFTAATAQDYGLEVNEEVDERYHLIKSTMAAARYFKFAHRLFGTWTSAAASYNRGIGGLQKAFKNQSVNSYYDLALNRETARYIFKILALKDLISSPKKYNLSYSRSHMPKTQVVKVDTTIHDLHAFARTISVNYELLKNYNPWLLGNTLTIKQPKAVYYLTIPLPIKILDPEIADTNRSKGPNGYTRNRNFPKPRPFKGYNT